MIKQPRSFNPARNQLTAEEAMEGMTALLEAERGWNPLSSGVKMPDFLGNT